MAESSFSLNSTRLRDMLNEALTLYYKIEEYNSEDPEGDLLRAIELCEEVTRMVSRAGVFSGSEEFSDIATEDIQYLILPFLLGRFTNQLRTERSELIGIAEIYFRDFLRRTNDYGLSNHSFGSDDEEDDVKSKKKRSTKGLNPITNREMKLAERQRKLDCEKQLTELKDELDDADDFTKREYYKKLIEYFIMIAIEDLDFLKQEKEMRKDKEKQGPSAKKAPNPRANEKTFKSITITKEMVQKGIFGPGYSSLPTMTVAEFYDNRVAQGIFPGPSTQRTGPMSLQEASLAGLSLDDQRDKEDEEAEAKAEKDDEEELRRKRDQDEFKDDHRRGYGNRFNRS